MFYVVPVSEKQIITTTPLSAKSITHVFFENKNDGVFTYKREIDAVTITIDGKMICKDVPVLPFMTSTPYGINQHDWRSKALEVNMNVNISEIKISASQMNDYNVVFVCADKPVEEIGGFDYIECKHVAMRRSMTSSDVDAYLAQKLAEWKPKMVEMKQVMDGVATYISDIKAAADAAEKTVVEWKQGYRKLTTAKMQSLITDASVRTKMANLMEEGITCYVSTATPTTYYGLMAQDINICPTADTQLLHTLYYDNDVSQLTNEVRIPDTASKAQYVASNGARMSVVNTNGVWTTTANQWGNHNDYRQWTYDNAQHQMSLTAGKYIIELEIVRYPTQYLDYFRCCVVASQSDGGSTILKTIFGSETKSTGGKIAWGLTLSETTDVGILMKIMDGAYKISIKRDGLIDTIKKATLNDMLYKWGTEQIIKLDKSPERVFAVQYASASIDPELSAETLFSEDINLNISFSSLDHTELPLQCDMAVIQATDNKTWREVVYDFEKEMPRNVAFWLDYNKHPMQQNLEFTGKYTKNAKPYTWDVYLFFMYKKLI